MYTAAYRVLHVENTPSLNRHIRWELATYGNAFRPSVFDFPPAFAVLHSMMESIEIQAANEFSNTGNERFGEALVWCIDYGEICPSWKGR